MNVLSFQIGLDLQKNLVKRLDLIGRGSSWLMRKALERYIKAHRPLISAFGDASGSHFERSRTIGLDLGARVSFRCGEDLEKDLMRLCQATNRDRSWHLRSALAHYLEATQENVDAIEAGMISARTEPLISMDQIMAKWGMSA